MEGGPSIGRPTHTELRSVFALDLRVMLQFWWEDGAESGRVIESDSGQADAIL